MRIAFFVPSVIAVMALLGCIEGEYPSIPPAPSSEAGASAFSHLVSWPPDGAYDVPREPELLALGGRTDLGAARVFVDGQPIAASEEESPCDDLGLHGAERCVRIRLDAPLPSEGKLDLFAGEVFVAQMSLGDAGSQIALLPGDCALFERSVDDLCLDIDDRGARLRGRLDRSARVAVEDGPRRHVALAPGGVFDLELPLRSGCAHSVSLRFLALDGSQIERELLLRAELDLAPIHLTESLANPKGPEPAQEYVELSNTGPERIDLAGYQLTDSPHRAGDVFPEGAFIPPRGKLLVAGRGYDPADVRDPSPPPGVPILRLGTSLTSGGLANSGEALYLLDPRFRRVSAMPAAPVPSEGECLIAHSLADRHPNPARFAVGSCSPGR